MGEESQQPTCPQVKHRRKCSHGEPSCKHSSQPSGVCGRTGRTRPRWGSSSTPPKGGRFPSARLVAGCQTSIDRMTRSLRLGVDGLGSVLFSVLIGLLLSLLRRARRYIDRSLRGSTYLDL